MQGISFRKGEYCFKGSEIDRQFSYGKLNALFNENSPVHEQQQEHRQIAVPKDTGINLVENVVSTVADIASGIGGLFDIQPSDYDLNEAEILRRKKKKQKPKGPKL